MYFFCCVLRVQLCCHFGINSLCFFISEGVFFLFQIKLSFSSELCSKKVELFLNKSFLGRVLGEPYQCGIRDEK